MPTWYHLIFWLTTEHSQIRGWKSMILQAIQNARVQTARGGNGRDWGRNVSRARLRRASRVPLRSSERRWKGNIWKALTREVNVLHFRKTRLATEGTTKEVGQNSTHRHLLQPSSQAAKVASAIATSHQGGGTDMGAGWLTAVGLGWWGRFVLCRETTDLGCLAASSSWPPYHYHWPLTHTEIMQESRPP